MAKNKNSKGKVDEKKEPVAQSKITEFLGKALKRHRKAVVAEGTNRRTALESIKFTDGEQWPNKIKTERDAEGRPCLTNNLLRKFVKQLAGDIRQNIPSIKIKPIDDLADVKGASVRQELVRNIEQQSGAAATYALGAEQALDGGFGYWRVLTEWTPKAFTQDIKIKAIHNRFTVYLDPAAQEYTSEDGGWGFITEVVDRDDFKEQYGNEDIGSFAEESGISMPSFFGYLLKYSIPILIPIFIIVTFIFL